MTPKSIYLLFVTITLFIFSCNKENLKEETQSTIAFTFGLNALKSAASDSISGATAIVISIETTDGSIVYNNKQVRVSNKNGSYCSDLISIMPGNYKLTKFMVIDNESLVNQVVPVGTSIKSFTGKTLPLYFVVDNGEIANLSLQVTNTLGKRPQDFGYATFNFIGEASFDFMIGVYVYNSDVQNFEFTSAHLTISQESNIIVDQDLKSGVNNTVLNEGKGKYVLTVSKDGYNTFTDTLSLYTLAGYISKSFSVLLEKSDVSKLDFVTSQDTLATLNIGITRPNASGKIRINWGDGNIEATSTTGNITHAYNFSTNYKVSISGNVNDFSKLRLSRCRISSINLTQCNNLTSIDISRNSCLKSLDLSEKTNLKEVLCVEGKIEAINMMNSNNIESIYCSVNKLTALDISNLTNLKTIYCDRNSLSSLDVSNNTNLQMLCCYQNNITSLDISNNTMLQLFEVRDNKLSSIDLSKNINLTNISIVNNKLTNLQINNLLVSVLQNVIANPRKGFISMDIFPSGAGDNAMKELENTYKWTVQ